MKIIDKHFFATVRLLFSFLGPKRNQILLVCLSTAFILVTVETVFALSMQSALNSLGLTSLKSEHLPDWISNDPLLPLVLFILLAFIRSGLISIKSYSMHWAFQYVTLENRIEIFEKGIKSADKLGLHELIDVFNEKVNTTSRAIAHLIQFLVMGTTVFVLFFTGMILSPGPMILSLVFLAIAYLPLQRLNSKIRKIGKSINTEALETSQLLVQGLRQNFFIKAYNLVDQEVNRASKLMTNSFLHTMKYQMFANFKSLLPMSFGMTIVLLVTYYFKNFSTSNYDLLSFFYLFIRLNQGATEVNQSTTEIIFHSKSIDALNEYKQTLQILQTSNKADEMKLELTSPITSLILNNVSFSFPGKKSLFENISVELSSGDFWVINGPSGVGKSTIISLLLKINKPQVGNIVVDGIDFESLSNSYVKRVGYSGAEPYLIPTTIRENLQFGHYDPESVSEEEMIKALTFVEMWDIVSKLTKGLDEKLNELPALSTGQRQRISLARAILRNPDLLLLDEATSHLDYELEERILSRLRSIFPRQIVIFISHRLKSNKFETKRLTMDINL